MFSELANENGFRDLGKDQFVARLACFYDQLNYIHPFREGNGRAQRVFWTRIAAGAGYAVDWDQVVGDENDRASRAAMEDDDRTLLTEMLARIVTAT